MTKNPSVNNVPAKEQNTLQKPYKTAMAIGIPVRGLTVSSPNASFNVCLNLPKVTTLLDIFSIKPHLSSAVSVISSPPPFP